MHKSLKTGGGVEDRGCILQKEHSIILETSNEFDMLEKDLATVLVSGTCIVTNLVLMQDKQ